MYRDKWGIEREYTHWSIDWDGDLWAVSGDGETLDAFTMISEALEFIAKIAARQAGGT